MMANQKEHSQPKSAQHTMEMSPREVLARLVVMSAIIFIAGLLVTTIWVHAAGYHTLPLEGEIRIQQNGEPRFNAYYPNFRDFAIAEGGEKGEETHFDRVGMIGTGAFFYNVLNAWHWIFEMNVQNLRGLILIPIIAISVGCYLFFKKVIPPSMQTPHFAWNYSILIGVFHSIFLILMLLLGVVVSSSYRFMFSDSVFYGGLFSGTVLPGIVMTLLSNLLYGSIAGYVLSLVTQIQQQLAAYEAQAKPSSKS